MDCKQHKFNILYNSQILKAVSLHFNSFTLLCRPCIHIYEQYSTREFILTPLNLSHNLDILFDDYTYYVNSSFVSAHTLTL